jgi:type I restriction enzyme S subunit
VSKNSKLTPRLRFPEFRKDTAWEQTSVGSKCTSFSGGTPDTGKKEYYGGKIPFIRSAEIGRDATELFLTERGLENSAAKRINKGDVLVALYGANSGDVALARLDGAINQAILCLRPEGNNAFLYHYLSERKSWIIATYIQGGQGNLSGEIVRSVPLFLPSTTEQHKIADCLSSLDDLIAAEGRKLESLRAYKKGLMQQLFPRDGETVPRLRFPEFREAGEWEEKPLKSLADYENGKAYEQDILPGGRFIVVNSRFVSTDGVVQKFTNAEYCTATRGDVLMVLSDLPNGKALAKCFLVDLDNRYAVNQRVARLKPTNVDSAFLYFRLNRHPRLLAYDDGLTQTHLSKGDVTDCLLIVPREIGEQQRIAECLSSLETRITAQSERHVALRMFKKGLMQQLFPSAAEVEI